MEVCTLPASCNPKGFESKMVPKRLVLLCLAAVVVAHGDHDEQKNIAGPHESLWYNRLPGDGGTQVCFLFTFTQGGCDEVDGVASQGGFGLFGNLDLWTTTVSPLLG